MKQQGCISRPSPGVSEFITVAAAQKCGSFFFFHPHSRNKLAASLVLMKKPSFCFSAQPFELKEEGGGRGGGAVRGEGEQEMTLSH